MTKAALLAGVVVLTTAMPGFSQTSAPPRPTEYFIVQDIQTKKCTIVEEKPTSTTVSVVGSTQYKTRAEAEAGMKAAVICSMT